MGAGEVVKNGRPLLGGKKRRRSKWSAVRYGGLLSGRLFPQVQTAVGAEEIAGIADEENMLDLQLILIAAHVEGR